MSIYLGDTPICGGIEGNQLNNPFSLLDYKFSEYELSNASWLRSNGQWNSGEVYSSVYNLLQGIYNETTTKAGVSVKLSTETYADTDFVLNTSDTTFRLPLKVALASGKAVAGNGMTLGLTNGTETTLGLNTTGGTITLNAQVNNIGKVVGSATSGISATGGLTVGVTTDQTKSGIETSANGLYLYFYVGAVVQDASVIAAASVLTQIAELLSCDYVVESKAPTAEDPTWYRVYKSGWVEQGGTNWGTSVANRTSITFPKEFADTNYCVSFGEYQGYQGTGSWPTGYINKTTTGFTHQGSGSGNDAVNSFDWTARGQGA